MMSTNKLPLVGLPADTYEKSGFQFHSLGDKYVRALTDVSKVPVSYTHLTLPTKRIV